MSGTGTVTLMSRATDDDGNMETPGPGVSVTVNCPCGLFGANYVPSVTSAADSGTYELGMKFQSTVPGWITGVRFYKGTGNDGTHTGSLWSSTGALLATGTFTDETSSGWQSMLFANPVEISANTTYVVSYYDPDGHYAYDEDLFDWPLNTPPLTASQANYSLQDYNANGVYNAGGPGFPTTMFNGTSYSVDAIFDTTQPPGAAPAVSSVTPYPGSSSNPVTTAPTVAFTKAVEPGSLSFTVTDSSGNSVPGTISFNSAYTVATFTPTNSLAAGTTYTVSVSGAQDSFGQTMTPYTFTFTTSEASTGQCPCSIWPDVAPSGATDADDDNSVTLGVAFQPSSNGTISGVRFYKEPDNTGSHVGSLWSSTGALLATGTFSNESTEGWQQLNFSSPVAVTAGTTYVASYFTSEGHYAATPDGLAAAVTNGPLTALADGGVYAYGSSSTFPTNTYNATNYWVDVVFTPTPSSSLPSVSSVTPYPGSSSNPVSTASTVTFSEAVVPSTASFTVTDSSGNAVPGSVTFNSSNTVATFTPTNSLAAGTTYTVSVSGAQDSFGQTMTPYTFTFTTSEASTGQCPCSIWPDVAPSGATDADDDNSVTLGVAFQPSSNGTISGVRFYKEPDNTGSHVGSLWSSTGALLATGTFSNESTEGWQQLNFSSPVAVTAGTTYVASYFTSEGHYAATPDGLAAAVTNGPLTALADGGVYAYGSSSTFPTNTYNATNYWVDVVFTPTPSSSQPSVTATNPLNGQTSVPTDAGISFTFNEAVQSNTIQFALTGPGDTSVPGTVSYDSATDTATFTSSGSLSSDTSYTATVSGAESASGTAMSGADSWNFTTAQPTPPAGQCPCSIWADSTQPSVASANDTNSVNLGVEFTSDEDGWITGIRFYKGAGNTGTHVGSLWSASGNLLAQVTFTGESTAGWQQANFSSPVQVTAGTTYIASYLAPNGGYSYDSQGLGDAVTNGPLTALANGGVYAYGSSSILPTSSYNATNYWVDVVFTTTAP